MNKDTIIALSFRLGERHRDRLKDLSRKSDVSQSDKLRSLIDKEYHRVIKLKEKRAKERAEAG